MRERTSRHAVKKHLYILIAAIALTLCVCLTFGTFLVSAHEESIPDNTVYTYYKSIEIQPGDTLWEIAEKTMPSKYGSVAEYVQVIKDMNNLSSDEIHSGQYLMIAYEDTEFIP